MLSHSAVDDSDKVGRSNFANDSSTKCPKGLQIYFQIDVKCLYSMPINCVWLMQCIECPRTVSNLDWDPLHSSLQPRQHKWVKKVFSQKILPKNLFLEWSNYVRKHLLTKNGKFFVRMVHISRKILKDILGPNFFDPKDTRGSRIFQAFQVYFICLNLF